MPQDFKYFGNVNLQQNTLSNVVIADKTSSQQLSVSKHELFFIDGDSANLYTYDGSKIIKVGSTLRISDLSSANSSIDLGGNRITNTGYPSDNSDAATKEYVLDVAFGNVATFDLKNANVSFDGTTYAVASELTYDQNMRVIDNAIKSIIPSPPLSSNSVFTSNVTLYDAILPNNLSSSWYTDVGAGNLINGYTVSGGVRLNHYFLSGVYSEQDSWGNVKVNINGTEQANVISLSGGETNFNYTTLNFDANVNIENLNYSNFWNNANVTTDVSFDTDGYANIYFISSKTGTTTERKLYYDDVASAPSFSVSPTNSENTANLKYLSNVSYYSNTSSFNLSFTGASGIFNKAYHPTAVATVDLTGLTQMNLNPSSVPDATDTFVVTNELVTINEPNKSSGEANGFIIVNLQKPNGVDLSQSTDVGKKINTYGNVATSTVEYFFDESYRLEANVSVDIPWRPNGSFSTSNTGPDAQVRNGFLKYPVMNDYPSPYTPTGTKEYHRRFYPGVPISSGYLEFEGLDVNNISVYGLGSLNAVIHLTDQGKYFDLGKDVCFTCDGNTLANAYPAKEAVFGSNVVNYTFETYSTGNESTDSYRLMLFFIDSVENVTKITHYDNYNE